MNTSVLCNGAGWAAYRLVMRTMRHDSAYSVAAGVCPAMDDTKRGAL